MQFFVACSNMAEDINWYKLKIRNKGLLEEAKQKLAASSIEFVCLTDEFYPSSCLQNLSSKYELSIYVHIELAPLKEFLHKEKESKIFKLFKATNSAAVSYDDQTVKLTRNLFHCYNGEFRIVNSIPTKAKNKECTINYLNLPDLKGYYQNVQKAQIDKFYMHLLEDITIFIPVPKGTYVEPDDDETAYELMMKQYRWMILHTYNEEDWYDRLSQWNTKMAQQIEDGQVKPCTVFLPMRKHKDRNGKELIKLLCRGYLFIKTTPENIAKIENELEYGVSGISKAVMQKKATEENNLKKKNRKKGKQIECVKIAYATMNPLFIGENIMTTFMFASQIESGEVEYDVFDFCVDEHVMYLCPDSPFSGRIGKLSRKENDTNLYIVFSLGNELSNTLEMPAIKVEPHQVRKLTEEEVNTFERTESFYKYKKK